MSADWSISRLQSWTCLSLPIVAEFVKLMTQSIAVEAQRQSADLYKVQLCNRQFFVGVHSDLRGKGIRVSVAWSHVVFVKDSILRDRRARSATAEGARIRRRRKTSAEGESLSQEAQRFRELNGLTISGAKLLQSPHKLDKLQLLGL